LVVPALVVTVATLLLAACGSGGPTSGVRVVTPDTGVRGGGAAAAGAEIALEVSTEADAPPQRENANGAAPVSPPAHLPQASLPVTIDAAGELPATVAVVGDSLTLSAQEEITAYLTGIGIDVLEVDGAVNRRMTRGSDPEPGIDAIEEIAEQSRPDLWVVALGTNDIGSSVSPDQFGADVVAVLEAIPDEAPVVWVDLWIRDRPDQIATANSVLRSMLAGRPGTAVADWFSHGDDPGLVAGDGIHLTDDGRYMFAATIAAATVDLFG
jgi:lysophospholipase L1-like esterase